MTLAANLVRRSGCEDHSRPK